MKMPMPRVKEGKLLGDLGDEMGVKPSPEIPFPEPTGPTRTLFDPKTGGELDKGAGHPVLES